MKSDGYQFVLNWERVFLHWERVRTVKRTKTKENAAKNTQIMWIVWWNWAVDEIGPWKAEHKHDACKHIHSNRMPCIRMSKHFKWTCYASALTPITKQNRALKWMSLQTQQNKVVTALYKQHGMVILSHCRHFEENKCLLSNILCGRKLWYHWTMVENAVRS